MNALRMLGLLLVCVFTAPLKAQEPIILDKLPFNDTTKERIQKGEIFVKAEVEDFSAHQEQALNFNAAGLHKKNCADAMAVLSQYENFNRYLPFVTESSYLEEKKEINLLFSGTLLPFNFRLKFIIPRIKKEGVYPFIFDQGFLTNLKGNIHLRDHRNRCLFFITAHWRGPDTGINTTLFEVFMKTTGTMGMEKLFRVSSL
jgi:hypothetical protein